MDSKNEWKEMFLSIECSSSENICSYSKNLKPCTRVCQSEYTIMTFCSFTYM